MAGKYTVYGEQIDSLIDGHCSLISEAVLSVIPENHLEAVVLGGGYGRGEGGVFIENGEEKLYNDYDMFVVIKDGVKASDYQAKLHQLSGGLEQKCGIDVDFGPIKTPSELKKAPFWLFNYELKYGHIVIWGNKKVLSVIPDYDGLEISLSESPKLMLNRGAGLWLSRDRLAKDEFTAEDNDFVTRNIYKAVMAQGDSIIMQRGLYHYSYLNRQETFRQFTDDQQVLNLDLLQLYDDSMEYKLRPRREIFTKDELQVLWEKVVDIHLKVYYFVWSSIMGSKNEPEVVIDRLARFYGVDLSPVSLAKNMILNLKTCHLKKMSINWYLKYPRYRLFYALPYMLGASYPSADKVCKALAAGSNMEIDDRFNNLWLRFN